MGFKSATFFSQSKMSQSTQLRHFEHCPRSTVPYCASKNCSELLDMTQTCPTKMLKIARNDPSWPEKTAQSCSKLLKVAQISSKLLKIARNASKCLKLSQNVSQWANKCLVLAYTSAKVVITWHCCCRCLLLHGLKVSVI